MGNGSFEYTYEIRLGIRPETPGCETIVFEPQFGAISFCDVTIPFNNGVINKYRRNSNNTIEMTFDSTASVRFIVPNDSEGIEIDGLIKRGGNTILLEAGKHSISYVLYV